MRNYVLIFFIAVCLFAIRASATECHFTTQRVQCGDRTCKDNKCVRCTLDADCYEDGLYCDIKAGGLCKLKTLQANMDASAILAFLVSVLVCCVGIVAGVGGGGILVPAFSVLLSLPVSSAVSVSQLTIVGQSLFSFMFIVSKKHDVDETRPLVNYQYLSLLMPMAIAGTSVGVQVGRVLPDIARIVLLMLTFVALLRRLVAKAVDQFRAARGAQRLPTVQPKGRAEDSPTSTEHTSLKTSEGVNAISERPVASVEAMSVRLPALPPPQSFYVELGIVFSSVVLLLIATIARQMLPCGSVPHLCVSIGPLVGLLAIFYFAYRRLNAKMTAMLETGNSDEISLFHFSWNTTTSIIFPLIAIGAGAAASMLGIGGGLILGFLFFEAGLTPQESSATSAVATLLVAGESVLQLSFAGMVQLDYAIAFLSVGAFSGFLGQRVIMNTIRAKGWNFLIIAALTLIVALSMICLVSLAVYQAAVGLKESSGSLLAWGTFCKRTFVDDSVHG